MLSEFGDAYEMTMLMHEIFSRGAKLEVHGSTRSWKIGFRGCWRQGEGPFYAGICRRLCEWMAQVENDFPHNPTEG